MRKLVEKQTLQLRITKHSLWRLCLTPVEPATVLLRLQLHNHFKRSAHTPASSSTAFALCEPTFRLRHSHHINAYPPPLSVFSSSTCVAGCWLVRIAVNRAIEHPHVGVICDSEPSHNDLSERLLLVNTKKKTCGPTDRCTGPSVASIQTRLRSQGISSLVVEINSNSRPEHSQRIAKVADQMDHKLVQCGLSKTPWLFFVVVVVIGCALLSRYTASQLTKAARRQRAPCQVDGLLTSARRAVDGWHCVAVWMFAFRKTMRIYTIRCGLWVPFACRASQAVCLDGDWRYFIGNAARAHQVDAADRSRPRSLSRLTILLGYSSLDKYMFFSSLTIRTIL